MTSFPLNSRVHPVILAGAGPGDPELLTVRAARAIADAEIILHDALVDSRILALAAADAVLIHVGKRCGRHAMSQADINRRLVDCARTGARVLRLKGGDPMVFGRAGEEIAALRAAGIPVEVIPGITAASAAAASACVSLTARGTARAVTLLTGHTADGGLPPQDWGALARLDSTLAFYMGTRHARAIADRLIEAGLDPATPAMLLTNVSRPGETRRLARLIDLADGIAAADLAAPALILIGAALDAAVPVATIRADARELS